MIIKALRLQLDKLKEDKSPDPKEIDKLGLALANKIAEALTYANEVYATEGSVLLTVLDQGKKKKLESLKKEGGEQAKLTSLEYNLRSEHFLEAVNENVGDSLHSLHTYHERPYYAVYRAGKYLNRMIQAVEKLVSPSLAEAKIPNYHVLKEIGENSVKIKAAQVKVGEKMLEGDPELVEHNDFFSEYGEHDLEQITDLILDFGAKVPGVYADAQKTISSSPSENTKDSSLSTLSGPETSRQRTAVRTYG